MFLLVLVQVLVLVLVINPFHSSFGPEAHRLEFDSPAVRGPTRSDPVLVMIKCHFIEMSRKSSEPRIRTSLNSQFGLFILTVLCFIFVLFTWTRLGSVFLVLFRSGSAQPAAFYVSFHISGFLWVMVLPTSCWLLGPKCPQNIQPDITLEPSEPEPEPGSVIYQTCWQKMMWYF